MEIADFDYRQPALGERRPADAVGQSAEEEFIRADAEADFGAVVVRGAGAAAEVEAAPLEMRRALTLALGALRTMG